MAARKSSAAKPSVEATTLYMIASVHHGLRARIEAGLKELELTPIQYTVLSIIDHHPGLSSAALARRFYVSPQNMGQVLTALEQRGLLTRTENPENRRLLNVTLTAAGKALQAQGAERMQAVERELLKGLPDESIAAFRGTLATLRSTLRD
ncbi:MAG: MarR family transcriptional regulator [Massilia sp.]|nr:MarR family transcriptional regulator [Massilia sp.]MDB5950315.1 MarR family transcriptional regulator [Massilia sp.]